MAKSSIHIDPANNIYEIDEKNFGQYCTCAEIKITPNNLVDVTLHLCADADIEAVAEIKAVIDGKGVKAK